MKKHKPMKNSSSHENKQQKERTKKGIRSGILSLSINLFLTVIKIIAAFLSRSVSIMADAMNSLGDSASSLLTIGGFRFASKPADKEHPYGHQRAEYISGLIVSIIILYIGLEFLISSVGRITNPQPIEGNPLVIGLLILSIMGKAFLGYALYHYQKDMASTTIRALIKDSVYDIVMTSVVLLSYFIETQTGLTLDGWIGVVVALFIIYGGVTSIRDAIDDLLGERPNPDLVEEMKNILDSYEELIGYHDLIVHKYGPNKSFATVDIEIDAAWSLINAHNLIDRIEKDFEDKLNVKLVGHLDPIVLDSDEQNRIHYWIKVALRNLEYDFHFHDFRIEEIYGIEAVSFDVVVPEGVEESNAELYEIITNELEQYISDYPIYIEFDRHYILDS